MYNFKFSKLLKLILVIALVVLCALLAWAIVLHVLGMNIQWWGKAMILTCLAATVIIIILLRKLWLKRREMKFVEGIIGTDMPGNISARDDASRELRRRFKEAVATLKKSHLKRKGNPLYVLPWYLMLGKSGAGKSTAIKSARLPSPFGDINRISGIEGTRNCDWWFFDDSVVIDIAGRYALHRNEDLDKSEWLSFLEHLVRYRKKEPINGIIATVEADQLLQADLEKIEEEGRTIRKRIEEVINVMGAKFPIYVLVTKCDLIFGMNRFCRLLSEKSLDQALGWMNHEGQTDITAFVNQTMDNLVDRLKDVRLILANREEVRSRHCIEPEVLLFPDEVARLRKGLTVFCKGAFKDNPFQELPPVRGIYLCSGQQAGRPVSSRVDGTTKIPDQELPGTGNGFFLHDFFARILPADRPLYSLTQRAREWHRLTHNLWLTGFATIVLIFCILLTHSWNENKAAINTVSPQYKQEILFKNESVADIGIMDEFGQQIKSIERLNREWRAPRLGLNASITLEKELKKRFCERFFEHFDTEVNPKIESHIANGGWDQNNAEPAVRFIPFLTRRINLLKARFNGAAEERLAKLPDPDYGLMILGRGQKPLAEGVLSRYKQIYINYLLWQQDIEILNKTYSGMQRLMASYFHENKGDLRWLTLWADRQLKKEAITMNTFWQSGTPDTELPAIGGAFTQQGRKLIGDFVENELGAAVEQNLWIVQPKEKFVPWYQDAYFGAWLNFCLRFIEAKKLFAGPDAWALAVERLAGENSPYFALMDKMQDELFALDGGKTWPAFELLPEQQEKYNVWLKTFRDFSILRQSAVGETMSDNPAAKAVGNRVTARIPAKARFMAQIAKDALDESKLAKGQESLTQYRQALEGFSGMTGSQSYAYQVARAGFEDNPAESKSSLYAGMKAIGNLKLTLDQDVAPGRGDSKDPFWCLLSEPLNELWSFSVEQAACHLQSLWDQEVIVKTQGIYDRHQLVGVLFGDQGHVEKYVAKHARPFLNQSSARGYYIRELQGCSVPFQKGFFGFIRQGSRWGAVAAASGGGQQSYSVDVVAYPTDVNAEARVKPYMTRLVLEGTEGQAVLENKQYPVETKFSWSPSQNGDVILQIVFENVTLSQKYTGYCAFGKFLQDFSRGRRIFDAGHFRENLPELTRIGVSQIEVIYQFQDHQIRPIIRMLDTTPGGPPHRIITCAKQEG